MPTITEPKNTNISSIAEFNTFPSAWTTSGMCMTVLSGGFDTGGTNGSNHFYHLFTNKNKPINEPNLVSCLTQNYCLNINTIHTNLNYVYEVYQ